MSIELGVGIKKVYGGEHTLRRMQPQREAISLASSRCGIWQFHFCPMHLEVKGFESMPSAPPSKWVARMIIGGISRKRYKKDWTSFIWSLSITQSSTVWRHSTRISSSRLLLLFVRNRIRKTGERSLTKSSFWSCGSTYRWIPPFGRPKASQEAIHSKTK